MSDIAGLISHQTGAICGELSSLKHTVAVEGAATRNALNQGFVQVSHELRQGFDQLDRRMEQGFSSVVERLDTGFDRLDQQVRTGFDRTVEELAGLRLAHVELISIASTPAHTAAMEHFMAARDAYVRGLLPEALEELERATSGVSGVSAGYKTDWRFHVLRGLIHLGVGARCEDTLVNPVRAFHDFEMALRYLEPGDIVRRSVFLTCGGRAKVMLEADAEDEVAIAMFIEAIRLDGRNVEARIEMARVAARRGSLARGLPCVQEACALNLRVYRVVEKDPSLAVYRPGIARQKSEEIRRLQQALTGLWQQLAGSVASAEQKLGVAWSTTQLKPEDDESFRRMRRSQSAQAKLGVFLVLGSIATCATLPKLPAIRSVGIGEVLMALLITLGLGIAVVVESQGKGRAIMLARAAQAAAARVAARAAQAFSSARDEVGQAAVVARAWTDCVTKLVILDVEHVDGIQEGYAACHRLDQLAKNAGL